MSDQRFECYTKDKRALIVAQRTCDEEVLDYDSDLETVRTKVYLQRYLRYRRTEVREVNWTKYSGIFE